MVLKGVSRSFYLSLRILPGPMRRSAALAYLLARASDTIADSAGVDVGVRLGVLEDFRRGVVGEGEVVEMPEELVLAVPDGRERVLLEGCGGLVRSLQELPEGERVLIREVLDVIVGGQRLDLERFGGGGGGGVVCLEDGEELEDYAWRVAGCVGEFWTKLGFLTLGDGFSSGAEEDLLVLGRRYGEGLQLVNILRDLPEDLRAGRCYLPVSDPGDLGELMGEWERWRELAKGRVLCGRRYAGALRTRRLRVASGLPGLLGEETLGLMEGLDFAGLQRGVKVGRARVYGLMWRALMG